MNNVTCRQVQIILEQKSRTNHHFKDHIKHPDVKPYQIPPNLQFLSNQHLLKASFFLT